MDNQLQSARQIADEFLTRRHRLLIGGEWVGATSGKTFPTHDPATGRTIAEVAEGSSEDIDRAVAAARTAFDENRWMSIAPTKRAAIMDRVAVLLETNADELAVIETLDNGKPLKAAKDDVLRCAEKFRYCAGWITKLEGKSFDAVLPAGWHGYSVREPVGVAGLIVPWNFPISMAVNKVAPALAAGCTMVLKPAEQTPLTALRLGELLLEAGVPAGVVNIVTGYGAEAGAALANHPDVDKLSFTGSTVVGKAIVQASTGNLKRVSLELGGKSPVIVFADADLKQAITGIAQFVFGNTGQNCGAGTRLYVDHRVYDQVLAGVCAIAEKLVVGSGLDARTDLGPIISQRQLQRVMGYIDGASSAGARVQTGGRQIDSEGYFVEPTVLTGTSPDMAVWREEIFGPVLCARSFQEDELDAVIADANNSTYGLGAYVWTTNLRFAHTTASRLKAGFVRVNGGSHFNVMPFGGYKQSGWGRESGREGIELFTEHKSVIMGL